MPRMSPFPLAVLLLGTAALLAACGTPQPPGATHMSWYEKYPDWKPGDPLPDGAPPRTAATPAAAPNTAPAPIAPPQRQAALPPADTPPPISSLGPMREPPPEPPKLEELRGLDAGQLTQLLGKPTLLRDEATAQMWQYRGETCVLHLFLYPGSGAASGEKRVQYVEARPRQTGAPAATTGPSECLATFVGARRLRS